MYLGSLAPKILGLKVAVCHGDRLTSTQEIQLCRRVILYDPIITTISVGAH